MWNSAVLCLGCSGSLSPSCCRSWSQCQMNERWIKAWKSHSSDKMTFLGATLCLFIFFFFAALCSNRKPLWGWGLLGAAEEQVGHRVGQQAALWALWDYRSHMSQQLAAGRRAWPPAGKSSPPSLTDGPSTLCHYVRATVVCRQAQFGEPVDDIHLRSLFQQSRSWGNYTEKVLDLRVTFAICRACSHGVSSHRVFVTHLMHEVVCF